MAIGYSATLVSRLKRKLGFGTLIVNFSGASSTGKTTAQELLISPYGCPEASNEGGLVHTFNATQNFINSSLNGIHGLPVALDDTTSNPYINLGQMIYTIASGNEKGRLNGDGTPKLSPLSGWSGTVIISSETPITDQSYVSQGQNCRVLSADGIRWTPDAETAEYIKRTVRENYGFTGIKFADYISKISIDDLYSQYIIAREKVKPLMQKRDNLSDRLEAQYAAIYQTVEAMNACFGLTLSPEELLGILLAPEQSKVEERSPGAKGLDLILSFVREKSTHFDRHYRIPYHRSDDVFASGDRYGQIYLYENSWELIIPCKKVDEILKTNKFYETQTAKSKWKADGWTKCETGRVDIKSGGIRCIHFIFPNEEIPFELPAEEEVPVYPTRTVPTSTPVDDYEVDDTEALNEVLNHLNETEGV